MNNKIELLAPAGNLEKLKWAIMYGADAVYIGGQEFSLRANATNFSLQDIKEGINYAHQHNAKVYVTVNIIFHNNDIKDLEEYLINLDKLGVDAIIVADPLVIDIVNKLNLNLELHLSTQACTLNYEAINFWQTQNIKRVVLGREVNKEDIKLIKEKTNMDIEVFIHGAMCASYSGRCVFSNYLTLRDSNRGGCSQICRFDFDLYNQDNVKISDDLPFTMCSKDLSMYKYLPDLINLNITSLKIEGRMRSIYYIATIVHIYRKAIDNYYKNKDNYVYNNEDELVLNRCANREACPQFFDKNPSVNEQYYNGRQEISNQDFLGIVTDYDKEKKFVTITERNYFKVGDIVQIFGPNTNMIELAITKIFDEENNEIEAARHPEQIIKIPLEKEVCVNDIMRIKII